MVSHKPCMTWRLVKQTCSLSSADSLLQTISLLQLMQGDPICSPLKSSGSSSLHSAFVQYLLKPSVTQMSPSWRRIPWCPALVSYRCITNNAKTQWLKKKSFFYCIVHACTCRSADSSNKGWAHTWACGMAEGSVLNRNWLEQISKSRSLWAALLLLTPAGYSGPVLLMAMAEVQ